MEEQLPRYCLLLSEWGLDVFVENFKSEGVTDESFKLLDEEAIKALIPKCGPRLIFREKFKIYLSKESAGESVITFGSTYASLAKEETHSKASTETFESSSIYTYAPDDEFQEFLNSNVLQSNAQGTSTPKEVVPTSLLQVPHKLIQSNEIIIFEAGPSQKNPKLSSIFSQGLEKILNKYPDGKLVLLKKGKLSNELRTKLTKVVITELFGNYGINNIKSDFLQKAALEIKEVFPNEKAETYFIPYDPVSKKGPKGKLYTKFINTKSSLKLANASLASCDKENTSHNSDKGATSVSPGPTDVEQDHLNFIKVATEPLGKVFEAWEGCYKLRQKLYKNADLDKIFEDFPCLKENFGLELIETDFNHKHPEKVDAVYRTWQKVSKAVLKELEERKINDIYLNKTVDKSAQTLLLLPYLFNPVTVKKSRKGDSWRPSRLEMQEIFFSHLEYTHELTNKVEKRRAKLQEYKLNLQPFGVIIGSLDNPKYVIVVDDVQYTVDTGVRALELLFKLFYGMDIDYPQECQNIWYFIEELIFNMKPRKSCPSTSTVVADVSFHLKEQ